MFFSLACSARSLYLTAITLIAKSVELQLCIGRSMFYSEMEICFKCHCLPFYSKAMF